MKLRSEETARIALVFIIVICVLLSLSKPEAKEEKPPEIKWKSQVDLADTKMLMSFDRKHNELMDIVIYGNGANGKPIVTIHQDGKVTLNGEPNEAARSFWKAVGLLMPHKCEGA